MKASIMERMLRERAKPSMKEKDHDKKMCFRSRNLRNVGATVWRKSPLKEEGRLP
jgi:hypothetical protein